VLSDQAVFLQGGDELPHIGLNKLVAYIELNTDGLCNVCLVSSTLQEFKDPRSDEVEIEHLTSLDIEDYSAILTMCATHTNRRLWALASLTCLGVKVAPNLSMESVTFSDETPVKATTVR